jgi:hypothetical protein
MPDLHGPWDGGSFGQAQYFRDRGPLEPSGVYGSPGANAGAGELGLTAVGFVLSLALGRAHVRGAAYERTGTAWTYTVPANTNATLARMDRLVLRRDLVAKTVLPTYLQGTPAGTPTAPNMSAAENASWDEPLFRITAPANSGTPLTIIDDRRWISRGVGRRLRLTSTLPVTTTWRVATWEEGDPDDPGTPGMWGAAAAGVASLQARERGIYATSAGLYGVTNLMLRKNSGGSSTAGTLLGGISGLPLGAFASASAHGFVLEVGDYVTPLMYSTAAQTAGTTSGWDAHFSLQMVAPW